MCRQVLVTSPSDWAIALTPIGAGLLPSSRRIAIDRLTAGTGRTRATLARLQRVCYLRELSQSLWPCECGVMLRLEFIMFVLVQTYVVFDNCIQFADHLQLALLRAYPT